MASRKPLVLNATNSLPAELPAGDSIDIAQLSGVEPAITAGTTAQYWRGDKTWRSFLTDVLGSVLTGLSTATATVITAADSVLVAIGKLQAQITATNAVVNPATSAFFTTIAGVPVTTISGDFISVSA